MDERQGARAPGNGSAATPVTLLLVPGPGQEGDAALALRGRLAAPDGSAVALAVMPDLAAALARPGDAPVIVLHQPAETALTGAMAQGTPPSEALAAWMAATAAQLGALRRNRRRITLVEAAALTGGEAAGGVLARLAARLGHAVAPAADAAAAVPTPPVLSLAPAPPADPVLAALARVCLADNADAQALASELEALVLGPAEGPPARTEGLADAAFAAHLAPGRDAGGRLGAERELLLDQMRHMQQQMDQAQAETDALARLLLDTRVQGATEHLAAQARLAEAETRLAEAETRLAEADTRAATAGAGLDAWTAERGLLLDQLGHMQQQVEQAQAEAAACVRLREEIRHEAPAMHALVQDDREARDSLLGNEILRLGRALQDALDARAADAARLAEDAAATARQLAERDADLDRLRPALDAAGRDLADTRRELAAVYASRSWRITGPMRKARLAVTKKDNPDG
ncbi:hypothetical protein RNZ50_00390 [Paracoccaceae bacterium Fryx2]|nr:hypothetical protein [Paracoccaceae bacterium Fryx2]